MDIRSLSEKTQKVVYEGARQRDKSLTCSAADPRRNWNGYILTVLAKASFRA